MQMLEIRGISKRYEATLALNNIHISASAGEVHAIVGENGAGKSTLMRVLSGATTPDSGELYIKGKKIDIFTPHKAFEHGIRTVYQEFSQIPNLSVAENILIGKMPYFKTKFLVDWKSAYLQSQEILNSLGFPGINVKDKISNLDVSQMQVVEIAKAITEDPEILILDEPSAVLAAPELEQLFTLIEKLKKKGTLIIYISHRFDEVFKIADKITILKDGEKVKTLPTSEIDEQGLIHLMVGRSIGDLFPVRKLNTGVPILKVENLSKEKEFNNISFELKQGEILGLFGLVGSGRTALSRSLFGASKIDSGNIILKGKKITPQSPGEAIGHGLAYLTKDRKIDGLVLCNSIKENMTFSILNKISKGIFLNKFLEAEKASSMMDSMEVKPKDYNQLVSTQSGGNQQKVLLSRWLLTNSKVLILNEPTRGVDVKTKAEIYKLIGKLAQDGLAIIMISSELPEIIGLSNRALVFRHGGIVGEFAKEQMTEVSLLGCASGILINKNIGDKNG
ncbi:MAG: sugar ABC transporter ATP-binding protein [Spirochaetaceae bacterium]